MQRRSACRIVFLSGCIGFLLTGAAGCGKAQTPPALFPFVLPWDDASPTVVDVSRLNPTPAGVNGPIVAKNGHFYEGKGRRVRFIGVNMAAANAFPSHADAEKVAARLHKFGVNIVRLHHADASWSQPNIFDPKFSDTQHLNKDSLDRLDYFVAQLKKNGIYANLNLHVSRSFTAADGLPDTDKLPYGGKQANYFDTRMRELQKGYAKSLLTHSNAYTGMTYAADPCVAVVEITNENTLLDGAWYGGIETLPDYYKNELRGQWNAWLKKKYPATDALKRAWTAGDKPYGPNRLLNADFGQGAEHWSLELNTAPADAKLSLPDDVATPPDVNGKPVRITVTTLGSQNWHIQFHQAGLDLTEGEPYTLSFRAKAAKPRPLGVYASLDTDDYHHVGLDQTVSLGEEWQRFALDFRAARVKKGHNRVVFVLGDALGAVDLADITLRPGVETQLPDATIEKGNFPLGRVSLNFSGADWISFLMDTERDFTLAMHDYIKNDLRVTANVCASQANFGGLGGALRESRMDFVDAHAYWQHPNFPRKQWDMTDWTIPNTAMVREANGGELTNLARYRVAGKPFNVSEYNHPAPNDYRAEMVPMLAAFAAVQDWDGFYLFDYAVNGPNDHDRITGFFDAANDPAKMAFLPAAALLFERDDMAIAHEELRLRVPESGVASQVTKYGPSSIGAWEEAGIRRTDAISQRLSLSFAPGKKPEGDAPKSDEKPKATSAITWKAEGTDKPCFTGDSPSSKVILGFVGGTSAQVEGWQVQMATTPRNFAAFTLSALDGRPTAQSKSLLLTAVGTVENVGMGWNATRTSVGDKWGTGPTQAEGVPARVTIRTLALSATVYALDGTGKRRGKVESKLANGLLAFAIGPESKTLWYEIEAQ